ncbi:hypothetical protein ACFY8X_38895 [Streptomyces tanashiensis]|uniref:hypothetical protein n=1 Tax=Streptomyces tanashiensis TaxID=67367 RepID=UPI0036F0B751
MTVLTHTRITPPLAHLDDLFPFQRDVFNTCMDYADNARDADAFNAAMAIAAKAINVDLPTSGCIVKCACPNCYSCDAIFDSASPGLREVEPSGPYNLPRYQCAACTDSHPAPHED